MKYFFFDTETTGLTGKDEVVQLAGFLIDEAGEILDVVNFYCDTTVPLSPKAAAVNGLSQGLLHSLSSGKYFEDCICKYPYFSEPNDILFVGYNVSFDIRLCNQTLSLHGYDKLEFGIAHEVIPKDLKGKNGNFCMLQAVKSMCGYRLKLCDALHKYLPGYDTDIFSRQLDKLLEYFNVSTGVSLLAHNALYDAFTTMMLFTTLRPYFELT